MAAHINRHFRELEESYLFSEIARRIQAFQEAEPEKGKRLIRLGIGDVTRPLPGTVVDALSRASLEMGKAETFRGYGPEQGYPFLREAIRRFYQTLGVRLSTDEIFVSDGAKSDLGNILDILDRNASVLITDPVYPVYVDTNIMDGRKICLLPSGPDNDFLPVPDADGKLPSAAGIPDIIYLCSPNNPTGAAYDREQLGRWVRYAREHDSIILFDSAYECFIKGDLPHSIYEIEGAERVAIEFSSLSKKAGFTGTRCGFTVVPDALVRDDTALNRLWLRRQSTKFNGVSYIIQRGAEAVFTDAGGRELRENLRYYEENAGIIMRTLDGLGIYYTGGKHSPYIWMQCPGETDSWRFFDRLLREIQVVGTPGAGFGRSGEGFFRLTAFNTHENTEEAMRRFREMLG